MTITTPMTATAPRAAGSASRRPRVFQPTFSRTGLLIGAFLFTVSLTPSLLPRAGVVQGLNSGVAFMIGYGFGASVRALWLYLNIPPMKKGRLRTALFWTAGVIYGGQAGLAIWAYVGWQNDTRLTFGMESLSPTVWPTIVGVALAVAILVLVVARSLRLLFRFVGNLLDRWLPRRLAITLSTVTLLALFWWILSGAFVSAFFSVSNQIFSTKDTGDKVGVVQPTSTLRSGGAESLVHWDQMGRQGRSFAATGPTVDDLNEFSGGGALEPIRAYVGLKSADTVQQRATLLLDELKRTGAFDRKALVVATTTGTGFLDPPGVDPFEYLFNGDTAIAGVQYSYLPSWISLLADQETVKNTSRVVFATIHDYWSTLPADSRPLLYLYGLSLGSYGVEAVLSSPEILNEPIDGALMAGPPFVNEMHTEITAARDEGTPPWQPTFANGRTVRFTAEQDGLGNGGTEWGPTRLVYLQHGSDPVVFFSTDLAFRAPQWLLDGNRPPDVTESMIWYPVVTMWQVLLDLPAAGSIPEGFGHLYSVHANLAAWVGVTNPDGWTQAKTDALATFIDDKLAARKAATTAVN